MISDKIKVLRERTNMSQALLAKKLDVTRSSVNDYLLGLESKTSINLDGYTQQETELLYSLIQYFDDRRQ